MKGFSNSTDDTIAYTDTFSLEENPTVAGHMYFVHRPDNSTIVHEVVHLSLGILNRMGYETLLVTTEDAPDLEEKLAELVGDMTEVLAEDLQS